MTLNDLAVGSVDSTKIQDGWVIVADLAANSVDASKIQDGSIRQGRRLNSLHEESYYLDVDVSEAWNPDNVTFDFYIHDSVAKKDSVITITLSTTHTSLERFCWAFPRRE